MSMAKVEQALALIRAKPEKCHFTGPRPEALIQQAESALGFRLPASYRRFVTELGNGYAGSMGIEGIHMGNFAVEHAFGIGSTLDLRRTSGLPETMVTIHQDGMGGHFVLDVAKAPPGGEPPVEVWEPGMSQAGDKLEFIAPDFGTWFLEAVQFGLRDDED